MVDKDVKSELIRQKEEKIVLLGTIHHSQNEFQDDNLKERKSSRSSSVKSLALCEESLDAGNGTPNILREDEKGLSEETVRMTELVGKEKEKYDKARDVCAANRNKIVASSGLL
ncbi:hypothetical protein C5167_024133 [Papaver somniferum]|uniref:Uncharacterized protein n=1 Tax=Papaver somniferum TaxID=3469 RepID=A0A4Y7JRE5_PAPSO|nr:hypothetical protein C5167_024133 [Papaver somniferum]